MISAANSAKQAGGFSLPQERSSYGSSADWAQILAAAGQGAGSALQGVAANAANKKEAREARRRTLASLLNNALKRNQGLFRIGQENADEMNDYQSQAMQQMAKGFVQSLQGSTGY